MPFEPMSPMEAAAWGLVGSFIVEALEYAGAIRRTKGWPWKRRGEPGIGPQMVAILLRLAAGTGLAAGAGAGGQIAGVFGAMVIGIATPLVVERILQQAATLPFTVTPPPKVPRPGRMTETPLVRADAESSDVQ